MNTLEGRVALVTGAASKRGMGHAIALKLAGEGAKLVVVDKIAAPKSLFPGDENWGGLDEEVEEIKALGSYAMAMVVDITSSNEVDAAVAATVEKFGKLDILVHCAAIRGPVGVPAVDLSVEEWRTIMDVNAAGSFLVAKAAAKAMIARGKGGKIVLIASMGGTHAIEGSVAYGASKAANISMMQTMALELAQYQINVNAINPGAIITNLRDEAFDRRAKEQGVKFEEAQQADYKMIGARIPMGRLGTAAEIADMAYFLVSDLSAYVTGEAIGVTGGMA